MNHTCPVCGWPKLHEPPRHETGGASFEICPCCGFEFGFDDDDQGLTYEQARARWIAGGMRWWSRARPAPFDWNAERQLSDAGFR
jgi:hypothetical protein